ncbi:MvdC/MvdD family ATP grasp protein [Streptomyces sp. 8L]|uniref:MvdC/MvdD family ATP grasp protein n=1 Tax=Streptomyces sp. 8L TaxID=2877242 RepID=UPI001CD7FBB7|nr:RimK domain-containing protein [Streptomyces sp. 8L]MCA1220056.1 RimK domain-containing protein [Streptomyces sp. 8L]
MLTVPTARRAGGPGRPVCLVTQDDNGPADRIVLELNKLDVPVLRFDLQDFPHHVRLNAVFDGTAWTGTLNNRGRTVTLEDIGAVLWWHPGTPRISVDGLSEAETAWLQRESAAGLVGVLDALDCLHVNHPAATRAAQLKAEVLAQAARCGLHVPATWIGNDPVGANGFISATHSGTVCKSLVSPTLNENSTHGQTFYTSRVEAVDDSIALSAHQLQREITKDHEVRLVVVGTDMYAARIDAHSPAAQKDFRSDYESLTYRHTCIPETVRKGISALLGHYGLLFAAIDLLVDTTGRWWLIDLNPAGQYDWLQKELPGLMISAGLARMLARPHATAQKIDQAFEEVSANSGAGGIAGDALCRVRAEETGGCEVDAVQEHGEGESAGGAISGERRGRSMVASASSPRAWPAPADT